MSLCIDPNLITDFHNLLRGAKKIVLVVHGNPDGDAIGSALALSHCLRILLPDTEVALVSPNRYPDFLKWMKGVDQVMIFKDKGSCNAVKQIIAASDLLICLDFNTLSRLDELGEFVRTTTIPRILIDHHIDPKKEEFLLVISEIKASSTAELIYRLISKIMPCPIPLPAAEAIMTGIITDTNMFRNNSSQPETFEIIAELLQLGVNKEHIATQIYDNFSEHRMKLLGYALSTKLVILPEYRAAYITMSQKELAKFLFQPGDTEGFVNFPLNIKGINLSSYISEQADGLIRFSFRSRGQFSVNDFARRHFNGGGHKNASGGYLNCTLNNAVNEFVTKLAQYKDEILETI